MLAERLLWWRLGQPLYALGALVAALGVGSLAPDGEVTSGTWLALSCALLVCGALAGHGRCISARYVLASSR